MKTDLNPKFWDIKSGKAIGRTNEVVAINNLIDTTKAAIHKIYRDLQERDNNVSSEKIKNVFLGIGGEHQNLLATFDEYNKERQLLVGKTLSEATSEKYIMVRNHLCQFIKVWYNRTDIPLKEINHKFICDFEVFMLTTRNCAEGTTSRYLQIFKNFILAALRNEWIVRNPFVNYKIQIKRGDRGYLTQDEVETLMQHTFPAKRFERARDFFIFSCFTGLSFIDVRNLRKEQIQKSFDGGMWIIGKRQKTSVTYKVPLLDIPKTILEKYEKTYQAKLPNSPLLPVMCNQNVNTYLKEIGKLCKIDKRLSFHLARHTFATLTLTKGVSIESVSKMLGHSSIQTTQIYARITNEKIGNDMAVFAKNIQGMETKFAVNI
jgi:site-specific recombinase XerD